MAVCQDVPVIIPGYLDLFETPAERSPLIDATSWADDPLFWPAFLWSVGGSTTAPDAFDADPADLDALVTRLLHPERWPVFSLAVAHHARVHVIMRNFADDEGVDYVLTASEPGPAIVVAALEGHFRGPALSWTELIRAANQRDPDHGNAQRLLLLLPAMGDDELPANASDVIAAAVTAVGGTRQQRQVATELLNANSRYWGACSWTDIDGVRTCLGTHSYRHPSSGNSLSELRRIADAFRGR